MTINNDLKTKKPVIGNDLTIKKLKKGEIKNIYIASNHPNKEKIKRYGKTFNVEVIQLKENNKELGEICKKPFPISTISFE